jgi:X-X-X-Leu-X-X-Gly heptad repeat protein
MLTFVGLASFSAPEPHFPRLTTGSVQVSSKTGQVQSGSISTKAEAVGKPQIRALGVSRVISREYRARSKAGLSRALVGECFAPQ